MKARGSDEIVEHEVQRCLRWRVVLLSAAPLPLLLLLLYFLYCNMKINREAINELRQTNVKMIGRIHDLERRIDKAEKDQGGAMRPQEKDAHARSGLQDIGF